jgi:DNA (cytosine-5)-methyltransferase 1
MAPRTIRVGSFCTGLDGAWQALEQLGLDSQCRHAFACDIDQDVQEMLKYNFEGLDEGNVIPDVVKAKTADIPRCDLLSGGFPCQPFSKIGKGEGTDDPRGTVVYAIIKYIKAARPKAFFLENVSGLVSQHRETFENILAELRGIKVNGSSYYRVVWTMVNTKEHGVPQSRPRCYIVGYHEDRRSEPFQWPAPVKLKPLDRFLDPKTRAKSRLPTSGVKRRNLRLLWKKIKSKGGKLGKDPYVGDVQASPRFAGTLSYGYSPCLTRRRCCDGGHWLFSRGRDMTTREMLRLQGMRPKRFRLPVKNGVRMSERKLRMMVGNAFSVNVVVRILSRLLPAAGLTGALKDPYGRQSIPA